MKEILNLIKDYHSYIKQGIEELQNEFLCEDLLQGWKQGDIPKSGTLVSGTEYEFHGVGCLLIINGIEVDFDFGPNNRIDGFDLWRLSSFVEDNPQMKNLYSTNSDLLKRHFESLEQKKMIYHPNWFPGSSLFYFAERGMNDT